MVRDALIPFAVIVSGHTVFKGHLQDRVVRETKAGTLDFYDTIRADAGFSAKAFLRYVTRARFGSFSTDVNYRTDGSGTPSIHPVKASRSSTGNTIGFDFNNIAIAPGNQSLFFFVKIHAKQFDVKGNTTIGMEQSPTAPFGSASLVTAEPVA